MALLPLVWLGWLRFNKRDPGAAWWWLAGALFVSWLADTAAHFIDPWVIGATYPLSQAAIVGAVFLHRRDLGELAIVLIVVAFSDVVWHGVEGPDIMLRTVAWLSIVGMVWQLPQLERLRMALLVSFGVGWLCWMGYAIAPGWWSWGVYQFARLVGILTFCWAATDPRPHFKLSRA